MESEGWITAEALRGAAEASGTSVTARQLELWRYRGLLPRPSRQKGGRARWLYPPGTREQLLRLLHWREQASSHDLVRIGLWVDGFSIELGGIRTSLLSFIDVWTAMLEREQSQAKEDPAAAVDVLARRFAGMRSKAPVPHVVRMPLSERTRAYGYMISVMFNLTGEIERRRGDAALLERMLGLRSGHAGGLSAVIALDDVSDQLARLPTPDQARRVIAEATADEYEFVRGLLQIMTIWTPLLVPLLLDEGSQAAQPFATMLRMFFSQIPPGFYPLVLCTLLVSLRAKSLRPTELRAHAATIASGVVDLELLNELPRGMRRKAFEKLPQRNKAHVARRISQRPQPTAQSAVQEPPTRGEHELHDLPSVRSADRQVPRHSREP